MKRLKMLWMASAAIAALVIGLTTTAQATVPVLGTTLAPTSTLGATMPATTLKATALQAKPEFGTSQFEQKTIAGTALQFAAKGFENKTVSNTDGDTVPAPSAVGNMQANDIIAANKVASALSFTNTATAHVRHLRAGTFQYRANSRAM